MEKGESKEKYYEPQYPLPEEIQEMARNDTVCHFCGVSYLIHNEIKSLHEQLQQYRDEVERLKGFDERERLLNDEMNALNIKCGKLQGKCKLLQSRNEECKDLFLQKETEISQLKRSVEDHIENTTSASDENKTLKLKVNTLSSIATKLSVSSKDLHEGMQQTCEIYKSSVGEFLQHWKKEKSKVLEAVAYMFKLYKTSEGENRHLRSTIKSHAMQHENKLHEADNKFQEQAKVFNNCMRGYERKMTTCTTQFIEFHKKHAQLCETYSNKLNESTKKTCVLQRYLKCIKHSKTTDEKSLMASLEKYKDDNAVLKEDNAVLKDERCRMVNSHQHQIKQLRDSFLEKLQQAEMSTQMFDDKLIGQEQQFEEEKKQLLQEYTESLNKADMQCETKCAQLNEKNENCKREIKKLDEKLKLQQRKFNGEKSQLLKEITESYEKASADTESRYSQMNKEREEQVRRIGKLEEHLEKMQVKFHEEMLKQAEEHEKEKEHVSASFERTLFQMKQQMEEQIATSGISTEEKNKFARMINELHSALDNAKEDMREKLIVIEENKNEISSLRDCVRRECEERYELTESLAEARTELLSLQRFKNQSPKKIASHPLLYNQKTSSKVGEISKNRLPNNKLDELSRSAVGVDSNLSRSGNASKSHNNTNEQYARSPSKDLATLSRYPKNKLNITLRNSLS